MTDRKGTDRLRRLTVLMPVFNDWESAAMLLADIGKELDGSGYAIDIVAVDDCSTEPMPEQLLPVPGIERIECLRLAANVGHQRAIAVGLMAIAGRDDLDLVAVMDSDGEDMPGELRGLAERAEQETGKAFVAQRSQRSEGLLFRLFYWLYVKLFRFLTGQRINFGNFSVLQAAQVRRVINSQHIWNNFPAAVIQARIPVVYVPTRRGLRYAGQSRMNFVGLVAHGLGAISVFSEAVFIRILIASALLLALSLGLVAATLVVRFTTELGVPNWATTVLGFALVISVQSLMMPVLMAFMLLNNRGMVQPLPTRLALDLIAERRSL